GGLSQSERDALVDGKHRLPLRVAPTGSAARLSGPPPTPGPARIDRAGSGPTADARLPSETVPLAAHGRRVDLRIVPRPRDVAAGTPASSAGTAALTLISTQEEAHD